MREMMKNTLILLMITLISGLLLGGVYRITKVPIMEQQNEAEMKACLEVFDVDEGTVNFDTMSADMLANLDEILANAGFSGVTIDRVIEVTDEKCEIKGYVLSVISHEGYGGDIGFYMGVTRDGVTNGISILDISETPGLGMRAEEVLKPQFTNRAAEQFAYTKTGAQAENEIDAISGATVTTKAVTNAVNAGLTYLYAQGLISWPSEMGESGGGN